MLLTAWCNEQEGLVDAFCRHGGKAKEELERERRAGQCSPGRAVYSCEQSYFLYRFEIWKFLNTVSTLRTNTRKNDFANLRQI